MTTIEKNKVEKMRSLGIGATEIAKKLGVSVNTVKAHCRRKAINITESTPYVPDQGQCKQCGRTVEQKLRRKVKLFCSDSCRLAWWNSHRSEVSKRSVQTVVCAYCGRNFDCYGSEQRKYCCHACYSRDRFGGERNYDARAV